VDKTCTKCGETKQAPDFYRARGTRDGYRSSCKACDATLRKIRYERDPQTAIRRVQEWRRANPERYLETQRAYKAANRQRLQKQHRDRHLKKSYGIVSEEFDLLVMAQMNLCAICFRYFGGSLHVDHDHRSGKIRGLLCGKCNKAIGLFDDKPQLADSAAKYLRRTASGPVVGLRP
jgi:hypothetical protein